MPCSGPDFSLLPDALRCNKPWHKPLLPKPCSCHAFLPGHIVSSQTASRRKSSLLSFVSSGGFFFLSLWREKQLIQSAETQWDQSPFRPCWQLICQLRLTEGFQCLSHGEGEHWYRRTSVFFLPEFCVKNPSSWYFSMLLCPEKQFKEVTKWNEALR